MTLFQEKLSALKVKSISRRVETFLSDKSNTELVVTLEAESFSPKTVPLKWYLSSGENAKTFDGKPHLK